MAVSGGTQFDQTLGNADADLSAKAYTFVKKTSTGIDTAGAGERMVGIQQNKPKITEGVGVRMIGTSKLVVDGSGTAIAAGDLLKADASGRGVKQAGDGEEVGAEALAASTAANDIIEVVVLNRQA